MNFTYENQGTNTYLVYTVQSNDAIDTMSLGMLTNNRIFGLAQTMFTQMDTTKYIKYNISAHVSVKQFFSGVVNKKRLMGVLRGIVNGMLSAEDYMIDTHSILLDVDYIYTDVSTYETVLICLPIVEVEKNQVELGAFFKNIMFSTQFDSNESCDYIAKIINYLNRASVFSLNEFKTVLDEIDGIGTLKEPVVQTKVQPVLKVVETESCATTTLAQQVSVPMTEKTSVVQNQNLNVPVSSIPKMTVPTVKPTVQQLVNQTTTVDTQDKISWFYLMQHYNKENAEKYKAQKNAKKNANKKASSAKGKKPTPPNPGFAIPGQQPTVQAEAPSQQAPQPIPQGTVQQKEQNPVTPVQQAAYTPRPVPQGQPMNFGETTVLGGGGIGETTVLNAAMLDTPQVKTPHLIRCKNQEKVSVGKPVFRIGKERSYVDYFIGDNSGISRSHANIVTREGRYYVVDTNSTNHTFVNGSIIQSNQEVEIQDGDKLRFANEDFEFRLC